MNRITGVAAAMIVSMVFAVGGRAADYDAEVEQASAKLAKAMPGCEKQMNDGDFVGANAALLAVFPAATRKGAESFVLGNVLFDADPKQSYPLHKAAAQAAPDNPAVLWEWCLEQHRAKEYAGALASYQTFSKARPDYAVSYALQADCLLHLGKIAEAADAWHKSETVPSGSIEGMEDMVCAVNREPAPHQRRTALLGKATGGHDVDAACDLIALDCEFPMDWWNVRAQETYLAHDGPAVTAALNLAGDDVRGRALACAMQCAAAAPGDGASVKAALTKYRLLTDSEETIPAHGGLLSVILHAAVDAGAVGDAILRNRIGPEVLAMARKGHDVELWNVAAFAGPRDKPEEMLKLEREGWKATGDARFAAGVLYLKLRRGELKGDDADLAAAVKQFPESGLIWRAVYEVATREGKVTRALLAGAARAEFAHFTSFVAPATVVDRPRSDYLRAYFAQMLRMPAEK